MNKGSTNTSRTLFSFVTIFRDSKLSRSSPVTVALLHFMERNFFKCEETLPRRLKTSVDKTGKISKLTSLEYSWCCLLGMYKGRLRMLAWHQGHLYCVGGCTTAVPPLLMANVPLLCIMYFLFQVLYFLFQVLYFMLHMLTMPLCASYTSCHGCSLSIPLVCIMCIMYFLFPDAVLPATHTHNTPCVYPVLPVPGAVLPGRHAQYAPHVYDVLPVPRCCTSCQTCSLYPLCVSCISCSRCCTSCQACSPYPLCVSCTSCSMCCTSCSRCCTSCCRYCTSCRAYWSCPSCVSCTTCGRSPSGSSTGRLRWTSFSRTRCPISSSSSCSSSHWIQVSLLYYNGVIDTSFLSLSRRVLILKKFCCESDVIMNGREVD